MLTEALLRELKITGLSDDSRRVQAGDLFFAFPAPAFETYAKTALEKGALAVVSENSVPAGVDASRWIQVPDIREARLAAAKWFFKNPFAGLKVHGVTGTNGKTTISFLMAAMLSAAGRKTALLGTICKRIGDSFVESSLTTPGLLELYAFARKASDAGCSDLVMEVSSHALDQARVAGVSFDSALFTNLTQDHLDYHGTMEAYFEAKKLLFTRYLSAEGLAVIHVGNAYGRKLFDEITARKVSVATSGKADFVPEFVKDTADGFSMKVARVSETPFDVSLHGSFNVENALTVLAWANELYLSETAVRDVFRTIQVPGRFQMVWNQDSRRVVVDYAHTPDALERVLATAREICSGKLAVVFGCGGDRDKTKRPLMGAVAEKLADEVWVTSDNPRTEDPEAIIRDILSGMHSRKFRVEPNRENAIALTCRNLGSGDLLVVAGKGHENYQIIGTEKHHFDDREIVLREMKKC
ncbi:MAG: UDP-N-acetylmuramoyl-L-alanyl-D-glutamate--2,6-diaminopimelate ligase [Fibrobacter sp.]|jgi:UDP-N-acetylmuramoyl-L-alanyl-D-glutamate--2,6-diaminopimelate ligase|nr:UDP-N-acetylmuramoyl-L-alanyl-D-glutamate--2,6-diaminopimelate ligase [Fibrobacter sp.]